MYIRIMFLCLILSSFACKSDKEETAQKNDSTVPRLTYQIPEGWIEEEPENAMRKAQFRLPGNGDEGDVVMTVFVFPASGGTVDANLTRWYRQFKQPDGSKSEEKARTKKLTVNNLQVTMVSLKGTYLKSFSPMSGGDKEEFPNSALLAAIVETNSAPWYFKAVGPKVTIERWQESFDQFVQSFVYK